METLNHGSTICAVLMFQAFGSKLDILLRTIAKFWKEKQSHEQTRQQLTAPKARNGLGALHSAQVWHESACMVAEEKQETRRNLNFSLYPSKNRFDTLTWVYTFFFN